MLPIVKSHNKYTEIVKSTCTRGVLGISGKVNLDDTQEREVRNERVHRGIDP